MLSVEPKLKPLQQISDLMSINNINTSVLVLVELLECNCEDPVQNKLITWTMYLS